MKEAFGFTRRLIHGDFSGNAGLAVKNSIYSFSTSMVAKIGSLLFTALIIGSSFLVKLFGLFSVELKPLLTPEVFGLYTLALSTILIFAGFSDLGIGSALVRYISTHGKNSRGYIDYLAKLKIILTSIIAILLIVSSYFISSFYDKPIFLALIAGSIYIISNSLMCFVSGFFSAENNFKIIFHRELIFQILRLIIVPIAIIYSLAYSTQFVLFIIFLSLALCYFSALLFLRLNLGKYHGDKIDIEQKKEVNRFILPLTVTALSGTFFGYIDIIMLGRFVESTFIAYYQAAFALLSSGITIISFSAVLFPIFSRLKGARLLNGLKKSILVAIPLSIFGLIFTYLIASFAVTFIYNVDYLPAVKILQVLSVLFLIDPLIGIYSSYFLSEGKSYFVAKVLAISTLVNILFNYVLIRALLPYGDYVAVFGAVISTILSRIVYLGMFMFNKTPRNKEIQV
jgi:O-antigen/teichoic acid export membrane protein